jgi:protein-tyrosine kinase
MSLIEQAAKRLEQLRRAGAALPDRASPDADSSTDVIARRPAAQTPTPEAVVNVLNSRKAGLTSKTGARSGTADANATLPPRASPDRHLTRVRAEIDLVRLGERGFVTPDAPNTRIAHEFRVLKRPILRNAQGRSGTPIRNGNLVMVTSALPGEGKTFTAANLAISMAMEFDNSVLLVDGDVAHPSLPDVIGLPSAPGLLDLLVRDDLDLGDVLLGTNIEKLTVLPAGSRDRRATELLASEKMANLLGVLASRYPDRIIIFDSPPLLATTEARVLATHMGQIVMVVAADSTSKHAVSQALATIENCEVVLMMLNKAVKTDNGSYYGYYADDVPI